MDKNLHYGELLKFAFRQDGCSVRRLSELTGKTTQQIYNIFRNKSPRINVVLELMRHLSTEMKLNSIDLVVEINNKEDLTRQKIVDHFTKAHEALSKDTASISKKLDEQEDFYPQKFEEVLSKLSDLEERLKMMQELVSAKNELITELRKSK